MKTVIVTGGIGSGKSAVCALLRERGIPVYDCDARAKALYDRSPALLEAVGKALDLPIRTPDGKLDKGRLAVRIFSDSAAREAVEALLYPRLLQAFKRWRSRQKGAPFVALESAVILSKPVFDGLADAVVLVDAPEQLRIQRVMLRDGAKEAGVRARMDAQQIPREKADAVLFNTGTPAELKDAAERLFFDKNSYLCKILNH